MRLDGPSRQADSFTDLLAVVKQDCDSMRPDTTATRPTFWPPKGANPAIAKSSSAGPAGLPSPAPTLPFRIDYIIWRVGRPWARMRTGHA